MILFKHPWYYAVVIEKSTSCVLRQKCQMHILNRYKNSEKIRMFILSNMLKAYNQKNIYIFYIKMSCTHKANLIDRDHLNFCRSKH